jgi:hypothetical protein
MQICKVINLQIWVKLFVVFALMPRNVAFVLMLINQSLSEECMTGTVMEVLNI